MRPLWIWQRLENALARDWPKHVMNITVKAKKFTAMDMTERSLPGKDKMSRSWTNRNIVGLEELMEIYQ